MLNGIIVISGFGGAGKSTLAYEISEFTDARVIGIDNDALWDGIWKQNDLEYLNKYDLMEVGDIIINYRDLL
jgi:adenylate kinase family enzyme